MLNVRVATRADIAAVDALLARAYPRLLKADYAPSMLVMALPLIARAQPGLVVSGRYFVAVDAAGQVLGAGGYSPDRRGRAGQVRHVVTDDRHQRQGIGRALLTHVLAEARAAGLERLDCMATLTAVRFYAALGFAVQGPITVPLAPGIDFPAVMMARAL